MRKKRPALESLGDSLTGAIRHPRWKSQVELGRLLAKWPLVVGTTVAEHATPSQLFRSTLTIAVENSAWMQELSFMKAGLLEKIQKVFPEKKISEIRFTLAEQLNASPENSESHRRPGSFPRG